MGDSVCVANVLINMHYDVRFSHLNEDYLLTYLLTAYATFGSSCSGRYFRRLLQVKPVPVGLPEKNLL